MKQVMEGWQDARRQWRTNPRLRAATYMAIVVAMIGAYLKVLEWKASQIDEASQVYQQLVSARNAASGVGWAERQELAARKLAEAKQHIWEAPSDGAAQALLRDALSRIARTHNLDLGRLALTTRPVDELGLTEVRAEFRGDYRAGQWQSFVADVSALKPSIRFDFEQIIRDGNRRRTWRMAVSALFDIKPEGS